jgi:hypothetical protein
MTDTATSRTATPALTPRQEAFARHYAASGNGAAAARAAGYAADSAKQAAHDLVRHPAVRDRVAALEDAHGRTLRGEVAVLLDRLDTAIDLAVRAGDHRAILDIVRLQAQVAALTGPEAGRRRALLYDRAGGPGPLARSRDCLDPEAATEPAADAAARAARLVAGAAADRVAEEGTAAEGHTQAAVAALHAKVAAGAAQDAELAGIAAELTALEAEIENGGAAAPEDQPFEDDPRGADPDFSLPLAGALSGIAGKLPSATARAALLASTAPVRPPEPARRAA